MSFDLISLIMQAGLIVKLVLVVLLVFSLTSLTIIVEVVGAPRRRSG